MSTGKRGEDKLNMVGIVAVGICGAVFTYVSVVLLQAFYVNETSVVETIADYRGQDNTAKSLRAEQIGHITAYGRNAGGPDQAQTYRIAIDQAMELVRQDAARDPANLIPVVGKSTVPTIQPIFGRPQPLVAPGATPPAPAATPPGAPGETPAGGVTAPAGGATAPSGAAPTGGDAVPAPPAGAPAQAATPAAGTPPPPAAPAAPAAPAPKAPAAAPPAAPKAPAKKPATEKPAPRPAKGQGGNGP